jgi:hypothetical protein
MKKLFLFALVAMMLCSCSKSGNNEKIPLPVKPTEIPINVSMGVWTRATDTSYESGDKVGIYVVNYDGSTAGTLQSSGNHVDNMRFSYTTKWTPDTEIYWKDQTTKADFYCYYPYGSPADISAYAFTTKADQSKLADYKASEFLWGKATGITPTANAVPIITNRSMCNMLIYVVAGEGFTAETLAAANKSVKISSVKTSATVDLRTGVATATGSAAEVIPYNEGEYYRALIVPQTVADGSNLITVTVDGVDYTLAKGFTFKANTQHKFTVTVNKSSGGVDIGIGDWEIDDTDNGGAAE